MSCKSMTPSSSSSINSNGIIQPKNNPLNQNDTIGVIGDSSSTIIRGASSCSCEYATSPSSSSSSSSSLSSSTSSHWWPTPWSSSSTAAIIPSISCYPTTVLSPMIGMNHFLSNTTIFASTAFPSSSSSLRWWEVSAAAAASSSIVSSNSTNVHSSTSTKHLYEEDVKMNLGYKLLGDVGISAIVALGAAPWISMIDKAVVEKSVSSSFTTAAETTYTTARRMTILSSCMDSLQVFIRNPIQYIRSPMFLIMWSAYASTYATANSLNTLFEHYESSTTTTKIPTTERTPKVSTIIDSNDYYSQNTTPPSLSLSPYHHHHHLHNHHHSATTESNTGRTTMLLLTTLVNTTATIFKDQYYTKTFGNTMTTSSSSSSSSIVRSITTKHQVPLLTYGLWGLRDLIIIGSTFLLPDILTDFLYDGNSNNNNSKTRIPTWIQQHDQKEELDSCTTRKILQVLCPMACPLIIGPIHLLSLDIYNRPILHSTTTTTTTTTTTILQVWKQRWDMICKNYTSVVSARIFRVSFGFAMGGLLNTYLRDQWRERDTTIVHNKKIEEE